MPRLGWLFAKHLRRLRAPVTLSVLISSLQALTAIPVAFVLRRLFDDAIPGHDIGLVAWLVAALFGLRLFNLSVTSGLRFLNIWLVESVLARLREDLVGKLCCLPRSYYTSVSQDELQTAVVVDTERVRSMSISVVGQLLPAAATSIVLVGVVLAIDWPMTVGLILVLPIMLLSSQFAQRTLQKEIRVQQRAHSKFARGISFLVRAMDLMRVHSFEAGESARQGQRIQDLRRATVATTRAGEVHGLLQAGVVLLSQVLMLLLGGYRILQGDLTLGGFFSFYYLANMLNSQLYSLTESVQPILVGNEAMATLTRLFEVEGDSVGTGTRRIDVKGNIELHDVSFSYGDVPVLDNVSLVIQPASNIAIQGVNGSGKTTLILLALGFYRPQSGHLSAEGVPYAELDLGELRRAYGVVPQTPFFFTGTLRENVTYGNPDASLEDLNAALELALATDLVASLPGGLETPIGDDGVRLSGGQRQRLALARSLLNRPRVLILDEPTNHLDSGAVLALIGSLASIPDPPAIVTITHDERLLAQASERYEMRSGRLSRLSRDNS